MRSGRSRDSGGMAEVRSIGVVGGGQMGSGIAQLAAVHGVDVWLHDTDAEALNRATKSISTSIQRFVSKGQLSQVCIDSSPSVVIFGWWENIEIFLFEFLFFCFIVNWEWKN